MNALLLIVLLFMYVIALQYDSFVVAVALLLAAMFTAPQYAGSVLLGAIVIALLKIFRVGDWLLLSLVVLGLLVGMMYARESRRREEIPPELIPYLLGGYR